MYVFVVVIIHTPQSDYHLWDKLVNQLGLPDFHFRVWHHFVPGKRIYIFFGVLLSMSLFNIEIDLVRKWLERNFVGELLSEKYFC